MIILTGASGGIGSQLIKELKNTDEVIGTYLKNKPRKGGEYHRLDVADESSVSDFIRAVSPRLKKVTLVNLAGISLDSLCHNFSSADWNRVLAVNLTGSFLMSRGLLPYMMKERWGRIINISSVVSRIGVAGSCAYAASKAGLMGLTRTLAKEYAPYGIRVNCLSLGYFSSGLIDTIPAGRVKSIKEEIPVKRLGDVRDISAAIEFLIKCDYITGAEINLNGGLY